MRYWTPEPIFAGRTAFILGGGPSLCAAEVARLDMRFVVAVNTAAELAPDAAILFSRDSAWCRANRALMASWRGLKIVTKRDAIRGTGALLVAMERRDDFPSPGSPAIRYGISSGHAAVSAVVAMAAHRIVMLGFDGRAVGGRTHWHDRYAEQRPAVYDTFLKGWKSWAADARRLGCEILNATPDSAITEFPFISLNKILATRAIAA